MEGTAETTVVADPTKMARQIMSSRSTIKEIIGKVEWLDESASPEEVDETIEKIRSKTEIVSMGRNILQISYYDKIPNRAFLTTKLMTDIFIRESQITKQTQSRSAFEFIQAQANIYHQKLMDAEQAIKHFQEKNIDSTPGSKELANERILSLKRQIEDVAIEIAGLKSRLSAKEDQLNGTGGTENFASTERVDALRTRVVTLKTQLEDLRLIYQDTYPDIVQIKAQINTIENNIKKEIISRNAASTNQKNESIQDSPVALELRSSILRNKADISTLISKSDQLKSLLEKERQKINRINSVEAEISELNRDYDVNQIKYNELVEQRENARISMSIDIDNQGVSTRIEEDASFPVIPQGLRFIHFIIAGLIASIAIPLGLVFGLTILDKKVRDPRVTSDVLKLPILASVYPVVNESTKRQSLVKMFYLLFVLLISWSFYGYEIWLRIQG